jgi:hypothetical protein
MTSGGGLLLSSGRRLYVEPIELILEAESEFR